MEQGELIRFIPFIIRDDMEEVRELEGNRS